MLRIDANRQPHPPAPLACAEGSRAKREGGEVDVPLPNLFGHIIRWRSDPVAGLLCKGHQRPSWLNRWRPPPFGGTAPERNESARPKAGHVISRLVGGRPPRSLFVGSGVVPRRLFRGFPVISSGRFEGWSSVAPGSVPRWLDSRFLGRFDSRFLGRLGRLALRRSTVRFLVARLSGSSVGSSVGTSVGMTSIIAGRLGSGSMHRPTL
jgi:hypothetical protein